MRFKIPDDVVHEIMARYQEWKPGIRSRLAEFRSVAVSKYFYELCYCLLTPQSKAIHCDEVVRVLEKNDFQNSEFNPEPFLHPSKSVYVRFHKTKSRRLIALKINYPHIVPLLASTVSTKDIRENVVRKITGLGYKEASHFLRNIGKTDVTILDRHILKNLLTIGAIKSLPKVISPKKYRELEAIFEDVAAQLNIPADELDLLLWSQETGYIFK